MPTSAPGSPPPRVVIQSVLYGIEPGAVVRAASAAARSAELAIEAGVLGGWEMAWGDCSPEPVFSDDAFADLRASLESRGGTASYTFFGENLGSAAGHNRLAATGSSELLIILNPDAIMAPDALTKLIAALGDDVGMVESRQIPIEHPKDYDEYTGDTSWASTACALTPRSLFDSLDGFDHRTFFLYGDDVDYSWRVRLAGFRVVFQPAARLFHDKRLTPTADWPASRAEIYYSAEASLMLAHKYSNPARVALLRQQFASEDGEVARALAEFERRDAAGELPDPLDPDHRVAQFHGDLYAKHRF